MTTAVVISLVGLIVIIAVHIAVIARWSGRIDGYMTANSQRLDRVEGEIDKLRVARHVADGAIQRHEGMLRELDRRQLARRTSDCPIVDGGNDG